MYLTKKYFVKNFKTLILLYHLQKKKSKSRIVTDCMFSRLDAYFNSILRICQTITYFKHILSIPCPKNMHSFYWYLYQILIECPSPNSLKMHISFKIYHCRYCVSINKYFIFLAQKYVTWNPKSHNPDSSPNIQIPIGAHFS